VANQYYIKNIIILFSVGAGFAIVLHILLRKRRVQDSISIYLIESGVSEQDKSNENCDLRKKYRRQFGIESLKVEQYHLLSVDQLQGILKIPLVDALKNYEMEQESYSTWLEGMRS
jgi:hypothetical protein